MIKTMRANSLKNIVEVPPAPQAGADLDAVEHFMLRCIGLHSETSNALQDALIHHFQAGGGRTRARLGLKAADALLLAPRTAIALAAAAELLHNASLIHDDLQDRSATRRGAPALWVSCGEETAICAGDLLISGAYQALARCEQPEQLAALITCMHERTAEVIHGQVADLNAQQSTIGLERYRAIAAAKSGPLLGLSTELALLAAGYSEEAAKAAQAARDFAIAYQILDDLHDEWEDSAASDGSACMNVIHLLRQAGDEHPHDTALQEAHRALQRARLAARSLPLGSGQPTLECIGLLAQQLNDIQP